MNMFQKLIDLGYTDLTPIIPPDAEISPKSSLFKRVGTHQDARGKSPGMKWPDGTWSGFDWLAETSTYPERWHEWGAGIGIKLGNGLVAIDADTLDEKLAKIILTMIKEKIGTLPIRIGQYPKALYLVRTDDDFQYARIEFGERNDKGNLTERVEILAAGRQFVAIGVHPKTKKPYHWPSPIPRREDVPFVPADMLLELLRELAPHLPAASAPIVEGATSEVSQDSLRGDMKMIEKAVRATPNSSNMFPSRESYRDFGYAIKAAAGPENEEDAFELFMDWCERWTDGHNDPDIVRSDWNRMKPPYRRGASWIYDTAEKYGEGFTAAEATAATWFDAAAAKSASEAPLHSENLPKDFSKKKVFNLVPFDQVADEAMTQSSQPLIKGLLDAGAMSIVYGPSNVGKTFVVMDLAYHVATGRPYAGMRATRGCVLYIAAEGGRGAKRRVRALREQYGAAEVDFLMLASPVDLRRPDADLKPLLGAIQAVGRPVALVVVDTLSRALAGGDENSSVDMGYIVNHFDVLRSVTRAHLMVVHHSGKNAAAGARGHSLLRAATDTEIEIGEGSIDVTKQRDLDKSWSSGFELPVRVLGVDEDGDPVTSCNVRLVRLGAAGEAMGGKNPTAKEGRLLGFISEMVVQSYDNDEGVSIAEIVEFCAGNGHTIAPNAALQIVKRLTEKGCLSKCLRGRWKLAEIESGQEVVKSVFS